MIISTDTEWGIFCTILTLPLVRRAKKTSEKNRRKKISEIKQWKGGSEYVGYINRFGAEYAYEIFF